MPRPVPHGRRPDGPGRRPWNQPAVLPGPVAGALGLPVGAAAALLAWLLGDGHLTGLILATAAAGGVALLATMPGVLAAAAQCWAVYDGFVVNRFGQLGVARPDLIALGVLCLVALVVRFAVVLRTRRLPSADRRGYAAPGEPHSRRVAAAD